MTFTLPRKWIRESEWARYKEAGWRRVSVERRPGWARVEWPFLGSPIQPQEDGNADLKHA